MVYTHHQNSQQLNLLDPTAVAENRIAGGVGEVTGAIPLPRPDQNAGYELGRRGRGEGFHKNANSHLPQNFNVAFTAMDARMGEIFWGVYRRDAQGFAELIGKESVTPATEVEFPDLIGVGVGSGWGVYRQELMTRLAGRVSYCEIDNLPRAGAIARLGVRGFEQGLAVTVEQAMPVYLRDKVAKKESER